MSDEERDNHPPEPSRATRLLAKLVEHLKRLQQVVQRLEEEKKRDAEALAAMQAELTEYRQLYSNWMRQQCLEEDWQDFKEEEYNGSLEELIEELDRQEGT
jgi:Skp family chaperone for outer membrane proteins